MPKSICVILPVNNAVEDLERKTANLVKTLSDLVRHFEIIIVDDGSTDTTSETALRLARTYPQVSVARHTKKMGIEAVIETGMQNSHAIIVFIADSPMSEKMPIETTVANEASQQQTGNISDDQLIEKLTNLGLTLKEYRVNPPKKEQRFLHRYAHPAVPKNHFDRFLRKISLTAAVENDEADRRNTTE